MTVSAASPLASIPPAAARLATACATVSGWRAGALMVLGGAASVLAMAPFHAWPILCLTLPVLVWRIDRAAASADDTTMRARRAAWSGWLFGFGYFLAGLFWIGEAFLVEAERFAVLMPFAVMLMPAGLALFWGAACAIAAMLWRPGLSRLLVLALAFGIAEWLRGHVLTGFPWNVLGYALTYPVTLMQSAAALGVYGLTLVVVLALPAPLVALAQLQACAHGRRARLFAAGLALLLVPLACLVAYGSWRLAVVAVASTDLRVRLVQPSVPQREKWRPENQRAIFERHLSLSQTAPDGRKDDARGIDLVIWPEAAMPFVPLATPGALDAIGRMLPEGTRLVSGALRVEDPPGDKPRKVFNSLIVFGTAGQPVAIYDKIHLVPFGEYLPLQSWLEAIGLEQLSRLRGGFTAGPRPRELLRLPGIPPFGPLICYEAIFPGGLVQRAERPAFLVNVTNDGWFGNTTGPRQHLHQARVRAVEEGVAILRVANNGISAVIDPRGMILARLDLDMVGVIDANVPRGVAPPPYARFGDALFAALLAGGLLTLLGVTKRS